MVGERHHLSCHCGACQMVVRLAASLETARRCDCSFCRRRGAMTVSVQEADLRILQGDALRLYQFGTQTAEHYFCSICGCYTHHRRASDPTEFGVNVGGLEGVNPAELEPIPWLDGVGFHPNPRDLKECG